MWPQRLHIEAFASPPDAQSRRSHVGRRALGTVGRTAGADERDQQLVLATPHCSRPGNDTKCCRGAGVSFGSRWSGGARRSGRALRPGFAALAGRTRWSLSSRFALWTLGADLSLRAGRAGLTPVAGCALRSDGTLGSLRSLRSGRADRSCRAGGARRAGRALRAWSRLAASGDAQCKYDRANVQNVLHRLATSIIQAFRGASADESMQPQTPYRRKIVLRNFCSLAPF
jgi:hypothetical protein